MSLTWYIFISKFILEEHREKVTDLIFYDITDADELKEEIPEELTDLVDKYGFEAAKEWLADDEQSADPTQMKQMLGPRKR